MIFKSIKWRLQIWHGLILLAALSGFGLTAFHYQKASALKRVEHELNERVAMLMGELRGNRPGPPPGMGFAGPDGPPGGMDFPDGPMEGGAGAGGPRKGFMPPEQAANLPMPRMLRVAPHVASAFDTPGNGYYYVAWIRDGRILGKSSTAPENVLLPDRPNQPNQTVHRIRGTIHEAYQFTPPGECILAGRDIAPELAEVRRFGLLLTGVGAGALALGLVGGGWLAARAIKPIDAISATASQISAGDLSQRIAVADTESELGRLVSVLNSTFSRLEASFAQQAQFTSDAAHELRTPVTVMLTQTQMTLSRERGAAEYRATVESCQRAAQRMRRLIESLLELARLDAGQEQMKRFRFDLAKVAQDCVELVRPLADERKIKLTSDLACVVCEGDSERIGQVVTNLVTNAINYNKEDGEVRVNIERRDGVAALTVSDTGIGISDADLPHVFDRFYRADKSRHNGRSGLGLAISKAIIEAHGGSLKISSKPGQGTILTIELPAY